MTNIAIRIVYEVYFEICLSVMINAAFIDFDAQDTRHSTGSIVCLILMIVGFLVLIPITLLFWKHGPSVKDSFEKRSFWKSFWWYRPIRQELLESDH